MAAAGGAGGRITAGAGANLLGVHSTDRNQDATCYVGNIDLQASEEIVWELFVQAGPVGEPRAQKLLKICSVFVCRLTCVRAAMRCHF